MTVMQSTIGDYRLVERIGGGAMGEVFRAVCQPTGDEVAIKLLPAALADDPAALGYFRRGAATTAGLRHPHILPVWHYGEHEGRPYLIMPLVRGGTLGDRIVRGPVAPAEALRYLRQLAAALDYAHRQGVVHRDVKPANLLFDERDQLYLADFGIARALENATRHTRTGEGVGTPEYMAPEQARGLLDRRADLYSAGIILYELLTGRVPFGGGSAVEVLLRHIQDPLPVLPLRAAQPAVPPAIEAVLQRALAKDPAARYASGADLVAAVEAALTGGLSWGGTLAPVAVAPVVVPQPLTATQGVALPPVVSPRHPARRAPALVGVSVALAVAFLFVSVGGAGAWVVRPRLDAPTATKSALLLHPTSTPRVEPSPSARPSETPAATPTQLPSAGSGAVPDGWEVYEGDALPFAIAYPPGWTVEEQPDDNYVLFLSPDRETWLEILTLGREKPGAHIDGERDNFNNAFRDSCERSGVEDTFNATFSELTFAALLATCEMKGELYAYYIGAGLYDDVPWYYVTFSPYGAFGGNAGDYFEPMLASLNIRAGRSARHIPEG